MCGFDGALGRYPRRHRGRPRPLAQPASPDELANALALCALHHTLFDLGVTEDRRVRLSSLYFARNEAGMAVDALAGKPLLIPSPENSRRRRVGRQQHHG